MTTDELIDLGHKAGTLFVTQFGVASATTEWLEQFATLVAAAEREACALVCDANALIDTPTKFEVAAINKCAAAIRARSNT